jgi:hypothetical protein
MSTAAKVRNPPLVPKCACRGIGQFGLQADLRRNRKSSTVAGVASGARCQKRSFLTGLCKRSVAIGDLTC